MEGISLILYGLGSFLVINLIALEGIIKYFILSSITGSFTILGLSFIFSLIGSLDFLDFQIHLTSNLQNLELTNMHIVVFIFFFSLFFKLAIFPFH